MKWKHELLYLILTEVWEVKKVLYSFRSDNFNLIKQIEVTYVHIAQ